MGLGSPQGDEKRLVPATILSGNHPFMESFPLSLSSRLPRRAVGPERSGAEGPAVPRTSHGNVFFGERSDQKRAQDKILGSFIPKTQLRLASPHTSPLCLRMLSRSLQRLSLG
jgi:hypothetical protein